MWHFFGIHFSKESMIFQNSGEASRWVLLLFTCSHGSSTWSVIGLLQPAHTAASRCRHRPRTTENFNYSRSCWAAALIEEGNNWFCPLRGENVSILRRSGCPPPAAGDKALLHCGCLICVTALVCAEIDVAFHAAVCGPVQGGSTPCASVSVLPRAAETWSTSTNMRRICINTDVWLSIHSCKCL